TLVADVHALQLGAVRGRHSLLRPRAARRSPAPGLLATAMRLRRQGRAAAAVPGGAPRIAFTRTSAALIVLLTIALTAVGQRIFVDATAAVYYNADQRIPEAVADGWWYAALWGILNGALAGLAYGRGILQ